MGRVEHRALLLSLGRAARLPALALATMASGPCGCPPFDECHSVSELSEAREAGLAMVGGSAGTSSNADTFTVLTAKSWDGASCPDAEQYSAIARLLPGSGLTAYEEPSRVNAEGDRCCYHFIPSCDGRPFIVRGSARVARLLGAAPAGRHAPLAEAWLADALAEHASIAAFARLTLQLMALGAPVALVEQAQLASLDEVRHARFCFERAARYGASSSPGALPLAGALEDGSLAALIESNLLEGCIGETLASERLLCRAELTSDEELRAALLAISEDERRHAELAFAVLAWCREADPALTREVTQRVLASRRPAPALRAAMGDALLLSERGDVATLSRRDQEVWSCVLEPLLRTSCNAAS